MQLDQITIATRPRNGWSAIDLGFKLGLKHFFSCLFLWLVLAAPFLIISMIFFRESYWVAYLLIWVFKPIFERPILFYLSRELFGDKTNLLSILRQPKNWLNPGWFPSITYRRFSPSRSFFMSLTVLEKLEGNDYAKRASVLGSQFGSQATWLTVVLYHIEMFFFFGLIVLIEFIAPVQFNTFEYLLYQAEEQNAVASILLQFFIFAIITPFYVASGFMLYIARRIQLEGWDIELRFRDWVAKHA